MSTEIKNTIARLLSESNSYNSNDVLVNALYDDKKLFSVDKLGTFTIDEFPSSILKDAAKTRKEAGVNSLCMSQGIIQLNSTQTPLLLNPIEYELDKVRGHIKLTLIEDEAFVNPYVVHQLKSSFDVQVPDELISCNDADKWRIFLSKIGLNDFNSEICYIGNFHHHRYEVLKELEELHEASTFSHALVSLFQGSENESAKLLPVFKGNLFPADSDHEAVFERLRENNLVIQGPPGTGKSQVLSNIVGKIMHEGNSALVLSEKRAALEVIEKRLAAHGLDKLCFIATSDQISKRFLSDLKSTWDHFESLQQESISNLFLSEQLEDNLQMTLDLLAQEKLIGDVSFQKFQTLSSDINLNGTYKSDLPSIPNFLENKITIDKVYEDGLNTSLGGLRLNILQADNFHEIDQKIKIWKKHIEEFDGIKLWSDISELMLRAADLQIFENDLFKNYSNIYKPNSRVQKRFLSLRKKMKKIELENNLINRHESHWKIRPSEIEVQSLQKRLKNDSWLKRVQLKRRWGQLSNLAFSEASEALRVYSSDIAKMTLLSQINVDFCDLGIDDPQKEVDLIYQSIHHYTVERWQLYEGYDSETRHRLTNQHQAINDLWHDLKNHLNLDPKTDVVAYLNQLENDLNNLIPIHKKLVNFDRSLLQLIKECSTKDLLIQNLYSGHWVMFKERFPNFSNFQIADIKVKVEQIISQQKTEGKLLAKQIEQIAHQRFKFYHTILTTPAQKLSTQDKELKKRLRKGKSLLVKEFSKTRSHPSLRELYNSEAKEWIQVLKPIWLSNPSQLAKCFPLQKELFDVCIFDEASQIPVQNALGAMQRSTRVIIAGDEHQMGPTRYFKSGSNEEVDLLHQANYYWKKVSLSHHYRSSHPDLIKFSNKHFYNNELIAYPSYPSLCPMVFHFESEGKFVDRKNQQEAQLAAKHISNALHTYKDVGIVAFSEEQLSCIWSCLPAKDQELITSRSSENLGFFKSIENVQGDECDHLIISFGYGKNEDSEFHMRFGPMNTENGRKRLNVLLTRARKSIEFIASVKSTDFKPTDNESVHLIQQWFQFIEQYTDSKKLHLPSHLEAIVENENLTLKFNMHNNIKAREIVTTQSVLTDRGWNINYL